MNHGQLQDGNFYLWLQGQVLYRQAGCAQRTGTNQCGVDAGQPRPTARQEFLDAIYIIIALAWLARPSNIIHFADEIARTQSNRNEGNGGPSTSSLFG